MVHVALSEAAEQPPAVDRVERIDPSDFRRDYFKLKRPLHVTGMMAHWPALTKWSFEYFIRLGGGRSVVLEAGNVLQGDTCFETAGLGDYLAALDDPALAGTAKRYLSLFEIFKTFPDLAADVDFSLIRRLTRWNYVFGWFGPPGTLTGYHIDWIDNILAQIVGRKRLWLVPPEQSAAMYPSRKYDFRSTLSSLDPDGVDLTRFPRFATVEPIEVTLHPGEMLFIPRGWWHRVQSLDKSISVNNFGHDLSGILVYQSGAKLKDYAHRLGLFRRHHCTCHMANQARSTTPGTPA